MTFAEYLASKKIDLEAFRSDSPELFLKWQTDFDQVHPAAFTARHLFQINETRRRYPLRTETTVASAAVPMKPRPVMRPKTN